ncbi:MAG: YggS family pyridoxal phosphate-dependent enzyme [Bdellovibrionota bacterium]
MESRLEIQNWLNKKLSELERPLNSVMILAASKLQPTTKILELHKSGQMDFGENYVQEALFKMEELKKHSLHWHLIGHLQKNKVKQVVGAFDLIHSIDSLELAEKVNTRAKELGLKQKILLQINQAEEKMKTGFQPDSFMKDWEHLEKFSSLQICGLMCLPPLFEEAEKTRPYFSSLRNQLEVLRKKANTKLHPLNHLSMGTSHDYQIAVEEGSTILRLGAILFGERIIQAKGNL